MIGRLDVRPHIRGTVHPWWEQHRSAPPYALQARVRDTIMWLTKRMVMNYGHWTRESLS